MQFILVADYLTAIQYQPPPFLSDSLDDCNREMERGTRTGSTSQSQRVASGQDDGHSASGQDDGDSTSGQEDGDSASGQDDGDGGQCKLFPSDI